MANKKKLKAKAEEQAKAGNLRSKLVTRLESAGVKNSNVNKLRNSNQVAQRTARASTPSPTPNQPSQPQKQPTMTGVATKDGRYSYGAQKQAEKNYQRLGEEGITDAFNPGKAGSRANVMADGFVNKKELNKFAKLKDTDADKARKKLSSKGAAFSAGANKQADSVFAKNNPFLAMMIQNPVPETGFIYDTGRKGKDRMAQQFRDSSSFNYKNKLPGEVFSFRPESGIQGNQPVPNVSRLNSIFSNPDAKKITEEEPKDPKDPQDPQDPQGPQDPQDPIIPEEKEEAIDPGQGMMAGGGMGAFGATKLGRAKSRLRRLGILGQGTGLLTRGLQYGQTINTGR